MNVLMRKVGRYAHFMCAALLAFGMIAETGAQSTAQQIKQRGELRIGVTPGEPWFFKDPGSGEWSGIGYRMGQQVAKDHGREARARWKPRGATAVAADAGQPDRRHVRARRDRRAQEGDRLSGCAVFLVRARRAARADGLKAKNWTDLDRDDMRIAVTLGTAPDRELTKRHDQGQDRALRRTWTRRSPRSIPGASTPRRSITRHS